MKFGQKFKLKYLQRSYRPGKPKLALGLPTKFFDEIEDLLTPDSEKKKDKKEGGKDK